MSKEQGTVTLREDVQDAEVVTEETLKDSGMSVQEIELAKKHNLLPKDEKDGEHDGKQIDEGNKDLKKDNDGKDSEAINKQTVTNYEDLDSFEKVHELFEKSPDKFRELPKNIKALYHNSKGLYKRAKIEEQKRQELEKDMEFNALRNKGAELRLNRIQEVLKKQDLTVEELEAIINDKPEEKVEKPEGKVSDQEKVASFVQSRIQEAEKIGKSEFDNFEQIVEQAQSVIKDKPRYSKILQDALADETVSEKELVDIVVDIARLNKDFGVKAEKSDEPVKADEKVDRMIKNSQKKPSSASVGSGSGNRTKSYDELTPEDVLRMDKDEYKKLPDSVRRRLKEQLD